MTTKSVRGSTPASSGPARDSSKAQRASSPGGLERARKLADAGQLSEAGEICRAHLQDRPQDSRAHYLLGAIQLASGQKVQAEKSFRRVVYLDHRHVDALTHLAALSESRGDDRGARGWRRRLERLAEERDAGRKENL